MSRNGNGHTNNICRTLYPYIHNYLNNTHACNEKAYEYITLFLFDTLLSTVLSGGSVFRNGYLTRAVQILRFMFFVTLLRRCCAQLWTWQSGHGALCLIWWFSARGRLRCLLFGGRMRCVGSHRTPTGILQESYRNPVGFLQDSYRNHTGLLQEAYRNPAGLLQDSHTTPTGLLQDSYRTLVGFPQDS